MKLSDIEIISEDGVMAKILVDGVELKGVQSILVSVTAGEVPAVALNLYPDTLKIQTVGSVLSRELKLL